MYGLSNVTTYLQQSAPSLPSRLCVGHSSSCASAAVWRLDAASGGVWSQPIAGALVIPAVTHSKVCCRWFTTCKFNNRWNRQLYVLGRVRYGNCRQIVGNSLLRARKPCNCLLLWFSPRRTPRQEVLCASLTWHAVVFPVRCCYHISPSSSYYPVSNQRPPSVASYELKTVKLFNLFTLL